MIKKFFFGCFLWILGVTNDERPEERLRARGGCREVIVSNDCVVVKFSCAEDAESFAEDLREFLNN